MKVCVLYGGTSRERDVSISSGQSILNSLSDNKNIFGYDFDGNYEKLLEKIKNVDLVFNALHGGEGEDGTVQKFLSDNSISFTGSGVNASKNAMDKHIAKSLCLDNNILTPNWLHYKQVIGLAAFEVEILRFYNTDIVIKPSDEGSSIGLSIIKNFDPQNETKR